MFIDNYTEETKQRYLELYFETEVPDYNKIVSELGLSSSDIAKLELILKLRYHKNYEDLPNEEWRNLEMIDFPEYYVSNFGRVRRLNRLKIPVKNKGGYLKINLYRRMKVKTVTIHRLVLIAFTNELGEGLHVNHKNFIKTDNRLENLEWCTSKENVNHFLDAKDNRTKASVRIAGTNNISAKLDDEKVKFIRTSSLSNSELANKFNVKREAIRRIRVNQTWKHV